MCFCGLVVGAAMPRSGATGPITQIVVTSINITAGETYTPYPTYTPLATLEAETIFVTITYTPTPRFTPTESLTPTITLTPSATLDPVQIETENAFAKLTTPKKTGFYLVNVDIAPGTWRTEPGVSDNCYWAINDKNQDTVKNNFGPSGSTFTIRPTDFEVEIGDCGTVTFLNP